MLSFDEYLSEAANLWGGVGESGHKSAKRKIQSLEKSGFKHQASHSYIHTSKLAGEVGRDLNTHTHVYKHEDGRTATHQEHEQFNHNSIHNVMVHKAGHEHRDYSKAPV